MSSTGTKIDKELNNISFIFPPLFGEDFSKGNLNWKRLDNVEFEKIGRVLACHLVIENYLNKLLELRLPDFIDIDAANLNFNQKLKMLRNDHSFAFVNFYQGITIINKIRNKYSHHIEAEIDSSEMGILKSILTDYANKINDKTSPPSNKDGVDDITTIEAFTSAFCAFIAGYCSSLVEKW